ncbi:SpoU rRNA Methylase family protein [Capnocytophaga haemolytica]|jgi:spoU rRNA methylase family protein|uniref:RNA methyltransferase n=1 Tax=Capnocytophaga haemolytica TaxID=45243 RepID=A0AAX2H1C1_9FLAO|nr:RNA methyltransferase [Capnocytophaga haemolytica]AMD85622.1 RNA methyltransferase [Capnocytophaga haemolytica]SFN89051.1 SpoU rRNA Methylase family protein [Capnocytophaga haemolytica]SNV16737.1 Putative TrmH family tRNA/rRNA methyltransferase [Capnocytophaga haemolytica]
MRKLANSELHRLDVQHFKSAPKTPLVVVLDNVRSLNNVGSVFRTADAFRIEKLVLCGITATPPNKEIHKTALGAEESVAWEYAPDTLSAVRALQSTGVCAIAVEQAEGATMLTDLHLERGKTYALVFGNEVKGVAQEVVSACDNTVEIPQYGTKHSLNVAVSAGVVIWECFKQLHT